MTFEEAMKALKEGKTVRCAGSMFMHRWIKIVEDKITDVEYKQNFYGFEDLSVEDIQSNNWEIK